MSLAEALKGIKEQQQPEPPRAAAPRKRSEHRAGRKTVEVAPATEPANRERRAGKSSRPDYEKVGLYIQTDLRRRAIRKFEDNGGRDLSDLIEDLLTSYLNA